MAFIILDWGYDQSGDYGSDVVAVFGNEVEVEKYFSGLSSFELGSKSVEQWDGTQKQKSWTGEKFLSRSE